MIIFDTILLGLAIVVCIYASLLIHEAGHVISARMLGIGVRSVIIGNGPNLIRSSIGKTSLSFKLFSIRACVEYNVEHVLSVSTFKKISMSLSGPLVSIIVFGATYFLYVNLSPSGVIPGTDLYSLYIEYGHIPGIPGIFYGLFCQITKGFINIVLIFSLLNLLMFCMAMLPFVDHDFGKSIFNLIDWYDPDFKSPTGHIYIMASNVSKSVFALTMFALSVLDIYRFVT